MTVPGRRPGAFVLVHGAWHGAWAWELLAPLLPGHVEAVELPGHGFDRTPAAGCTAEAYAARTVEALERAHAATGEPALLVGHSLGGMTVAAACEARPELVRAAVYLCAYLPRNGESAYGLAQLDPGSALMPDACVLHRETGLLELLPERVRDTMYADVPAAVADAAIARLCQEPLAPMGAPAVLTAARHGSVPRVYVRCDRDRIITPELQAALAAASPCRVIELAAGHSPLLAAPAELAALLASL